jgi:hypothetical protein
MPRLTRGFRRRARSVIVRCRVTPRLWGAFVEIAEREGLAPGTLAARWFGRDVVEAIAKAKAAGIPLVAGELVEFGGGGVKVGVGKRRGDGKG